MAEAKLIEDPLAPQCGNCKFWSDLQRPDGAGECMAVPPTPILLGAQPAKFGTGLQFQVEMFRPILNTRNRPCGYHHPKLVFDLSKPA